MSSAFQTATHSVCCFVQFCQPKASHAMAEATTFIAAHRRTLGPHLSAVGSRASLYQGDGAAEKREGIDNGKKNERNFHVLVED